MKYSQIIPDILIKDDESGFNAFDFTRSIHV